MFPPRSAGLSDQLLCLSSKPGSATASSSRVSPEVHQLFKIKCIYYDLRQRMMRWLLICVLMGKVTGQCGPNGWTFSCIIEAMHNVSLRLEEGDFSLLFEFEEGFGSGYGLTIYASATKISTDPIPDFNVIVQLPRELEVNFFHRLSFIRICLPQIAADQLVNSDYLYNNTLIGLTVMDAEVSGLRETVNISMNVSTLETVTHSPRCVFVNDSTQSELSLDTYGCSTQWTPGQSYVVCSCDHLTFFGVLMITNKKTTEDISAVDKKTLTYISFIGCSFSFCALLVAIGLFITNRKVRSDVSMKIHVNLVAALLLLNMHFLPNAATGIWTFSWPSPWLCFYLAIGLHFSLLSSFSWMAVEGFHLYLLLVKVFNIHVRKYLLKVSLVGWGFPTVVVSIVVIIDRDLYGSVSLDQSNSTDMCYIRDDVVKSISTMGLFGLVFLFNLSLLTVAVRNILRLRKSKQFGPNDWNRTKKDICTLLGVTTLLGTTWGLIFFSFGQLTTIGLYAFSILNSLQGVFILVPLLAHKLKRRIKATCVGASIQYRGNKRHYSNRYSAEVKKFMENVLKSLDKGNISSLLEFARGLGRLNSATLVSATLVSVRNFLSYSYQKPSSASNFEGLTLFSNATEISTEWIQDFNVIAQLPRELPVDIFHRLSFIVIPLPQIAADQLVNSSDYLYNNNTLIGLSVMDAEVSGLRETVNISMNVSTLETVTHSPRCVFVNDSTQSELSLDTYGCSTQWTPGQSYVVCSCDHLTFFGVLMITNKKTTEDISAVDKKTLTYISFIGCSFSFCALLVAVGLFITNRKVRSDVSMKIHVNLVAALLLLNMHFLPNAATGIWTFSWPSPWLCFYLAIGLHFSLLSSFSWMAVEGFHLYLLLVKVFNINIRNYLLKVSLVGWGVPTVVVSIVVIIDRDFYGSVSLDQSNSTEMCFIRDDVVKAVSTMGLFGLVFLFNLFLLMVVVRKILSLRKSKQFGPNGSNRTKKDICTLLGVTTLLGTTWGLIFFSFGQLTTIGLYAFSILNSLQGVFILVWFAMSVLKIRKASRGLLYPFGSSPGSSSCSSSSAPRPGPGSTSRPRLHAPASRPGPGFTASIQYSGNKRHYSNGCSAKVKESMKNVLKFLDKGNIHSLLEFARGLGRLNSATLVSVGNFRSYSYQKPLCASNFEGLTLFSNATEISTEWIQDFNVIAQLPRELPVDIFHRLSFIVIPLPQIAADQLVNSSDYLYNNNTLIGLTVMDAEVSGLRETVNISMNVSTLETVTHSPRCVFVNDSTQSELSLDTYGCSTQWTPGQSYVVCSCDHLTFFGVLMITNKKTTEDISAVDKKTLTYISFIGCSFSFCALLVAVGLFITNRKVRSDVSMKIHVNLVAALLLLNMHFLPNAATGIWTFSWPSPWLCFYLAIGLHFSLLSSFSWMAVEGFHLYLLLVKVFNINIRKYLLKVSLVGWGVPTVVVSIVVIIDRDFYGSVSLDQSNSTEMCFIRDDVVKAVSTMGLFGLVFLFNLFLLMVVVRKILSLRKSKQFGPNDWNRTKKDICTLLGVTTLLGTTWGLIFFSFGQLTTIGLYAFSILNSLQGVFILVWFAIFLTNAAGRTVFCDDVESMCLVSPVGFSKCYENEISKCSKKGRQENPRFYLQTLEPSEEANVPMGNHRVQIPSSALKMSQGDEDKYVRVVVTVLNSSYFKPESAPAKSGEKTSIILDKSVLVVKAGTRRVGNLSVPVKLLFHPQEKGLNGTCVFWEDSGDWNTDGCTTDYNGTYYICSCNHLSFFAVLVNPAIVVDEQNALTLTYVSYVGSAFSVVFTLMSLFLLMCLHWRRPEKALEMGNSLLCKAMGIFMHWSLLATFSWVALEGFHLYLLLVRVFNIYVRKYVLKISLFGWGFPTLVSVFCTIANVYGNYVITDANNQTTIGEICWISNNVPHSIIVNYVTTVAFPCVVILCNGSMLGKVICQLWGLRRAEYDMEGSQKLKILQKERIYQLWKDAVTVLGLSCVLGLPWGLACVSYISTAGIYVFTVFNALQGFLIFLWCLALRYKSKSETNSSSRDQSASQKMIDTSL
uniref:Uncharacterized protein n=1 Tax=Knipowitschia caucasica TaxID=637954 RepID=A0AAV2LRR3_KNICA